MVDSDRRKEEKAQAVSGDGGERDNKSMAVGIEMLFNKRKRGKVAS